MEVDGNQLRFFIDGQKLVEGVDNRNLEGGTVSLWSEHVSLTVRSFKIIKL
jgi:hypothetical protein